MSRASFVVEPGAAPVVTVEVVMTGGSLLPALPREYHRN